MFLCNVSSLLYPLPHDIQSTFPVFRQTFRFRLAAWTCFRQDLPVVSLSATASCAKLSNRVESLAVVVV